MNRFLAAALAMLALSACAVDEDHSRSVVLTAGVTNRVTLEAGDCQFFWRSGPQMEGPDADDLEFLEATMPDGEPLTLVRDSIGYIRYIEPYLYYNVFSADCVRAGEYVFRYRVWGPNSTLGTLVVKVK